MNPCWWACHATFPPERLISSDSHAGGTSMQHGVIPVYLRWGQWRSSARCTCTAHLLHIFKDFHTKKNYPDLLRREQTGVNWLNLNWCPCASRSFLQASLTLLTAQKMEKKMGAHANQLLIIQVIKTKEEMVHFHAHFSFWRVVCKVSKVNGNLLDTDTLYFFLSHAQQTFEDLYDEPFPI